MTYDVRDGSVRFKYAAANAFLCLVPGSALSLFGGGQLLVLPKPVIELLFPLSIFPPEKLLIITLVNVLPNLGRISSTDFQELDPFTRQFFTLAFLSFFLVLAILTLQARANALYTSPNMLRISSASAISKALIISVISRIFLIYFLVVKHSAIHQNSPSELAVSALMHVIAPEALILMTCVIANAIWKLLFVCYLRFFPSVE